MNRRSKTPGPAAVILAAGQGTRMKSAKAKVLFEFLGRPLIDYPVELALSLGADPIVAVVGHQADAVTAHLAQSFGPRVGTALQSERLGTGHAVLIAKEALAAFDGYLYILYGDGPLLTRASLKALAKRVMAKRNCPLGLISSALGSPTGYGRLLRDANGKLIDIVEERDASDEQRAIREANMGIYFVERAFLFKALSQIGRANAQGEYYLTDLVRIAVAQGQEVAVYEAPESETRGINDRAQLYALEAECRQAQALALMKDGVTLIDPASVQIDARARIAQDVTLGPNVIVRGPCTIGRGTTIDQGNVIEYSVIGEDVALKPYNVIEHSEVRARAQIGPFAHLRPQSVIGPDCHVGNFCETKNTELVENVKANHLSYLGDARIGRGTNVGAGTITCNYDGYIKSRTEIGEQVFIGSDTQLVAPVTIPDRVILGAGTTLTGRIAMHDGDLVLTRPEAVVVPGYFEKARVRGLAAKAAKKASDEAAKKAARKTGAKKKRV